MNYQSTRSPESRFSLSQAIIQGLASDGGLFVPESWPKFDLTDPSWQELDFASFASRMLAPFFAGDELLQELENICRNAFNFPVPVVSLDETTSILELFHGPTSAFKDFGARFLAASLARFGKETVGREPLVLVATSGDTGGAVAAAFAEFTKIRVAVLFPKGRISKRQQLQLTTWGPQVRAFEVRGTFDDCQKVVKEALSSSVWQEKFALISANSINLGRLLPQMSYFAWACTGCAQATKAIPDLIVPSGNLGNSVAALWAKKVGFPIGRVGLAHNQNDAVPIYVETGNWHPKPSLETLANAMDVGNPSNFERLKFLYPDWRSMLKDVTARSISDEEIRQTIRQAYKVWGQILCPHTATALAMREHERKIHSQVQVILAATAHPAKFETTVEPLIARTVMLPSALERLIHRSSRSDEIGSRLSELEAKLW